MEIIDQLRQAADIVDIASQYTTLKRRGRKHVGLCPFHAEKDPSFTVDSEKQLFHCFGCGVGGDVFTLVMEKENLTFPEVLNYLAEKYHIPLPQKSKLSPELQKLEERVYKANEEALAFFRRCLFQKGEGETALAYLKKRGLSGETIEALKVGYAPNSWNALLTYFQGRRAEPALLEKAGLVLPGQRKPESYDRFRGRVIFPIFSLTSKVVAFGGRTIADADPKYLNSPDTPVYSKGKLLYGLNWTKEAVREAGELILVEGYTDFASLYQAGIRNVAASLGTALTPYQVDIARRATGPESARIIINYDGDSAGRNAAFRAVPLCFEKAVQTQVLVLPENLDPDAFIRKCGPKAYLDMAGKSVSGLKFLVDMNLRTGKMSVPEEKSRIVKSIVAELDKIPDSIVRSEYLRQTGEYLGVDESFLRQIVEKRPAAGPAREEKAGLFPAEKRLLEILLQNPEVAGQILLQTEENEFSGLASEAALRFMRDCVRARKKNVQAELSKAIPPQLSRWISEAMLERLGQGTMEEAMENLTSLRRTQLESLSRALQKEIDRCQRNGEKEKLAALLSQRQALTRKIISM
ncbi:MAG: DNA primase [Candidatus Aminicenantes bacterium RBG_13_59_9]|nr:MAG: DNA primase [Candidatus Aminicenantes bacterium RBG_13_59_9]